MKDAISRYLIQYGTVQNFLRIFHKDIPYGIKNFIKFGKVLWKYRWYDWIYPANILQAMLEDMATNTVLHGNHINKDKVASKIKRASYLLRHIIDDNVQDLIEQELGLEYIYHPFTTKALPDGTYQLCDPVYPDLMCKTASEHINNIISNATQIRTEEFWNEFIDIIKGQDITKLDPNKTFEEQYDGSGFRNFWD